VYLYIKGYSSKNGEGYVDYCRDQKSFEQKYIIRFDIVNVNIIEELSLSTFSKMLLSLLCDAYFD